VDTKFRSTPKYDIYALLCRSATKRMTPLIEKGQAEQAQQYRRHELRHSGENFFYA